MPKNELGISARQIKVLSEPSRLHILSMLFAQEMSISGLAKALGLSPATVHHHVNVLLKAGLIRMTRRVVRGNVVEKYYEMPARGIDSSVVWDELKDPDKVAYRLAILGMLKDVINDAMKALQRRGTVEWEAGRALFYRVPWRRDALLQVEEIFDEARRKLEKLEAKGKRIEGEEMLVLLTTLPT
ncbi:MAG: winged helix-turn-helix transcriptional regulator [Euryarchaeota archaeon]|nr:winged helix-turn-helix transcriptional regulator [Euryarchaeota archaeon]